MTFGQAPSVFWVGLTLGATYALIGLGWVIIFRATKVLNFATASFFVLGAYLCYWMNNTLGVNIFVSVVAAMLNLRGHYRRDIPGSVAATGWRAALLHRADDARRRADPRQLDDRDMGRYAPGHEFSAFDHPAHNSSSVAVSAAQLTQVALAVAVACAMTVGLRRTRFAGSGCAQPRRILCWPASQASTSFAPASSPGAVAGAVLALGGILYASQNSVTDPRRPLRVQAWPPPSSAAWTACQERCSAASCSENWRPS